jgi:tetratricopeptide (TPR) repeat protein
MATISTSTINQVVTDVVKRIARVQEKLGRYDQALKSLTEALKFQRQEYGNDHMIIATTLNEIGIIHGNQGRTRLALQYFEESLRIRQLLNDPDQGIITTAMFNIAHIHIQQGDSAKAVLVLKELVEYELSKRNTLSFGSDNPSLSSPEVVLSALEQMAHVLQDDLQNPLEALNCLKKGIRIIMDSSGSSAPNVNVVRVPVDVHVHSRYLGMAGNICLKLGDMGGAIRFFADTMRVNLAGGLAFHANIRPKGYDMFFSFENTRPPAAPAA